MKALRLLLFLFTLLLVAATCLAQMPPGSGSRPANPQKEQELLDEGVNVVEDHLELRRGVLRPAFRYNNEQHSAIMQHLLNPSSRFANLYNGEDDRHIFMISPWEAVHPGEAEPRPGILAFTVHQNGKVEPAFHASFAKDAKTGAGEPLGLFFERIANIEQSLLFNANRIPEVTLR
ncbi:uncharacterized protein UTRI_06198 [Ustilago trichophora]|uniref:Uncharacterized protein n=1 Tax=Ustilago trichophora TaxID=86804 RepID=A0A5C3EJ38_9BASI|nr:uncharacterized protein UTRI_06198 [Ustilago trichophora]